MTIDWWTLGLQTANVLILIWILARFLFRPVAKIIADRQAAAHAALDAAQAARDDAEAVRDQAQTEMARTRAALLVKAQDAAKRKRADPLAAARAEAEKARAETRAELERMRAAGETARIDEAGTLAADIAARLVGRLPEPARIDGFIDGLVQAVRDLPEATRAGIGAEGHVRLRAARALTGDERARLEARLAKALGCELALALEVEVAPALIAGLELNAPQAIVRNNFRADLDRIAAELARHDCPPCLTLRALPTGSPPTGSPRPGRASPRHRSRRRPRPWAGSRGSPTASPG